MARRVMTFEEWCQSPSIYASYGDYKRNMQANEDYQKKLEHEKLAEAVARQLRKSMEGESWR